MQPLADVPDIDGFDIAHLLHIWKIKIGHADLLPLIQKGCSPQGKHQCCQRLGAFIVVLGIVAVAGDRAGLIVIFEVDGVPRKLLLPLGNAGKEAIRLKFAKKPFYFVAVGLHVLEGEHRGKLTAGGVYQIVRHLRRDKDRLAHRKGIVL